MSSYPLLDKCLQYSVETVTYPVVKYFLDENDGEFYYHEPSDSWIFAGFESIEKMMHFALIVKIEDGVLKL